ncbi:uncharacterized protein LOC111307328 [Durio zibethinus]|uniref:Uncharacterized protein LOC111307328 n=1 Tax=Durio zibethinus TaxID=66656 RepID=A0A6P6A8H9_DURZI|nr:uncharacterized protein LOC111307328 [Durio zibethinus]
MMALKSFPKLSILTVIVALVLSHNLYEASGSAASGGRMGGSSFSSERSPSSSRHHHHYYHHSSGVYSYNSQPSFSGNANQENGYSAAVAFLIVTIFVGAASLLVNHEGRISILQIQVGLSAKAHSLQRELTEIALTTDTSTANGWNIVLEETISSLLHHQNCYIYSYSSVTRHWTIGGAEWHFKRLSKEEREKFDVQSLVNINNTKRQRAVVPKADKVNKDCIVVTVLVAAQGAHSLPTIWTTDDMKEALQSMAEICSSKLKAVEVLWSPQDETDSLSVEELLENYPQLRRL